MGVHKQSVSLNDTAFAFAHELVESSEYPNISASLSGEMVRASAVRERERVLFEIEVQRRLALPLDAWEPISAVDCITTDAREHLTRRTKLGIGDAA
jgi:antitoxin ParD1/3/4